MIIITGASGQLGRLVVDQLAGTVDPSSVLLGSRTPDKCAARKAAGFKTAKIDFNDPKSMTAAFTKGATVLVISTDAPNDVRIVQHGAAINAAKRAGVARLVYTSFFNPSATSLCPLNRLHAATEAMIQESGVPYTFLRNNQYADNLALSLPQALAHGALAQPGIQGKVSYVTRADLAAATATVLSGPGHENKRYDLTGPEALSACDIAAQLSKQTGKAIQAVEMEPLQFGELLKGAGLPPFLVEAMLGLFAANAAGEFAPVTDHVRQLTGREPTPATRFIAGLVG